MASGAFFVDMITLLKLADMLMLLLSRMMKTHKILLNVTDKFTLSLWSSDKLFTWNRFGKFSSHRKVLE